MYNWNDILIVGDSWCHERDKLVYWPNQLLFELTGISKGTPRGRGFPGCAWWSVRTRLFKELNSKPAKVVIIIHTEANRMPSDKDRPITIRGAMDYESLTDPTTKAIFKAAAGYYNHLYSANFHDWVERQWFFELDNFLKTKQVEKVIHLYGVFKHKEQKYTFNHGVTIDQPLSRYHVRNTAIMQYPNHLTYENNQKLALFLSKLITNYPGHGFLYTEMPL
jgi:hypothetical protein